MNLGFDPPEQGKRDADGLVWTGSVGKLITPTGELVRGFGADVVQAFEQREPFAMLSFGVAPVCYCRKRSCGGLGRPRDVDLLIGHLEVAATVGQMEAWLDTLTFEQRARASMIRDQAHSGTRDAFRQAGQ